MVERRCFVMLNPDGKIVPRIVGASVAEVRRLFAKARGWDACPPHVRRFCWANAKRKGYREALARIVVE